MQTSIPRILLAGLSGGSGKTIVSLSLVRALVDSGLNIKPFKKGPDYIDAAWLSLAAKNSTTNLDPYFCTQKQTLALFHEKAQGADISVIEGNRGLFDGKDVEGSCSTAQLARYLNVPIVLIVDCTKMTRTAAAIVTGCINFEKGIHIAGVILNRTAGVRHSNILCSVIRQYTDAQVLGVLPKLTHNPIPERHMGLVSDQEFTQQKQSLGELSRIGRENLDLDALTKIAHSASPLTVQKTEIWPSLCIKKTQKQPVIAYVRDAALWFYYPENLESLERAGAKLVCVSLLENEPWPEIHGLYLGGGFPETLAKKLAENTNIREHVATLAKRNLPIYAECGGFMYLCREVSFEGRSYPMSGVLPLRTEFCSRPKGLGYTESEVVEPNPFYPVGTKILGHEFHYSHCIAAPDARLNLALKMQRGQGMLEGMDGVVQGNVMASYNHIFALAVPKWAPGFVQAAVKFMENKLS